MSNKKKRKETRERTRGKEIGRDISLDLRSRNRVKSRTTNDQAHPLHYAHRSRDLNVPLEMVVCSCTGKTHVVKVPGKNY